MNEVVIRTFETVAAARAAEYVLQHAGIRVAVAGEMTAAPWTALTSANLIRLEVLREDARCANELLSQWTNGELELGYGPLSHWKCATCGEVLKKVFSACWKCGTMFDGTIDPDFAVEATNQDDRIDEA